MNRTTTTSRLQVKAQHKRFLIACILAGPGSGEALAADNNTTLPQILRVSRQGRKKTGGVFRSWRIEQIIENFTRQQFESHQKLLAL